MNEVKVTPVIVPQITKATSSEDIKADSPTEFLEASGKVLPVQTTEDLEPAQDSLPKTEEAIKEVNQFVQSVQRDLHFSVDEDSGMTIIRVRDKESGELIRQIPEDIFLNLARNLKEGQGLQLLNTHG